MNDIHAVTNQTQMKTNQNKIKTAKQKRNEPNGTSETKIRLHDFGDHQEKILCIYAMCNAARERETGRHIQTGIDSFWCLHSSDNY